MLCLISHPPLFGDMGRDSKRGKKTGLVGVLEIKLFPCTVAPSKSTAGRTPHRPLFCVHHGFTPLLLILFNLNCNLHIRVEKIFKASITRCKGDAILSFPGSKHLHQWHYNWIIHIW
uniref:Uncharacterized protein n=1 Tax=Opuntia streptacantha TaxID=393608 RepID=A0A7C9CP57_OPUST